MRAQVLLPTLGDRVGVRAIVEMHVEGSRLASNHAHAFPKDRILGDIVERDPAMTATIAPKARPSRSD